jgi:phage baseplate assembly protein V
MKPAITASLPTLGIPRFGIVTKVDYKKARCRVALREQRTYDEGERFETGWLFVAAARTSEGKSYWMPAKGETVACFVDEFCEQGVVLCSVYTEANATTGDMGQHKHVTVYNDGTRVIYDEEAKKLTVDAKGSTTIDIATTADITIKGATNISIEAATTIDISGTATITGGAGSTMDGIMDLVMKRMTNTMKDVFNAHKHAANLTPPLPTDWMIPEP